VAAGEAMFRDHDRGFEEGLAAIIAGIDVTLRGP
jgi:hypothetical protein